VFNPGPGTGRIRERIVLMAKDNGWEWGRIRGERKRLGRSICKRTMQNILLENGFDLGLKGVVVGLHSACPPPSFYSPCKLVIQQSSIDGSVAPDGLSPSAEN
jgi:hypothetical protein